LDLCLASGERLLGRRSSAREEQSRKQPGPMEETPSGIATEAREVQ